MRCRSPGKSSMRSKRPTTNASCTGISSPRISRLRLSERSGPRLPPGEDGGVARIFPFPLDVADAERSGDIGRSHPRHGGLHESRAGTRQAGRPPDRCVGLWVRAVRDADGQAGLRECRRHCLGRAVTKPSFAVGNATALRSAGETRDRGPNVPRESDILRDGNRVVGVVSPRPRNRCRRRPSTWCSTGQKS
jgi:hypothetical protein